MRISGARTGNSLEHRRTVVGVRDRSMPDDVDTGEYALHGRREAGGRGAGHDRTGKSERLDTSVDRVRQARHDPHNALPLVRDAHDCWR